MSNSAGGIEDNEQRQLLLANAAMLQVPRVRARWSFFPCGAEVVAVVY